MTERDRILCVYNGEVPDQVPLMLDLSHWYYQKTNSTWDVSNQYTHPESELINCHKKFNVGFYLPNLAKFYQVRHPSNVQHFVEKGHAPNGAKKITWRIQTKAGCIERERIWNEANYAWGVSKYGIKDETDLEVYITAMRDMEYSPRWDLYTNWENATGDIGLNYMCLPYSGVGMLLNNWLGIEEFFYAMEDMPELLKEAVDTYNANLLNLVDLVCMSPADVIFISDNFSGDVQPPHFFREWSAEFYLEAVRRIHKAGKKLTVHIDGKLRGAIGMISGIQADAGDAITPKPMGDLSPAECRKEAGADFILSGGVPPNLWLESSPLEAFDQSVIDWLDLRKVSPRLILAAGDQVPIGTPESRILRIRELVDQHGKY